MKNERYIYILTDSLGSQRWSYGSMSALCAHFENPLNVDRRTVNNYLRKNGGNYPVIVQGCTIDRVRLWTMNDVRDDNPATLTPEEAAQIPVASQTQDPNQW